MPRNKKLAAPQVMRFTPFKSPVDGSMITGPESRRAHNKKHGVVDIGNEDPKIEKPKTETAKELLIKNMQRMS